jgi:hypothetical protein
VTPRNVLLDESRIRETLDRLTRRIEERFPGSGLGRVSADVATIGRETSDLLAYLRAPQWAVRLLVGSTVLAAVVVVVVLVSTLQLPSGIDGVATALQASESLLNELVFLGVALFFLAGLEDRVKRKRALASLHRLRSVAHIVDMHQLTKDPERVASPTPDTASSPERTLTVPELGRYLDYCSELLSVISKLAALHVQDFSDSVTLAAVNDVETLCSGLSNKIWQKITLLEKH